MSGWIKLHRKIKDSAIWSDSQAVHLWVHLLLKVNHAPKEVIKGETVYNIKRGQTLTGRKVLSAETGINESKIQRLLKLFVKCKMIEQQTNNANRLVSVLNYESYQVGEQQTNNKRTTNEQQTNTNKNDKKEKNEKKPTDYPFELFWEMYDKKTGKPKCESKYEKLSEEIRKTIFEHVLKYKESQPDKQFRKNPDTYLNQQSWNDEIVSNAPQKPQQREIGDFL